MTFGTNYFAENENVSLCALSQLPFHRMLQYVRSFGGKPRLLKKHEMESTDIVGTKKYLMELKGPVDLSPKKVLRQRRSQTR